MRNTLFTLCFFISSIALCQEKFNVGFGFSNQGQTHEALSDFYFLGHESSYQDDAFTGRESQLQLNLIAAYQISDRIFVRLRVGQNWLNQRYEKPMINDKWIVTDKQTNFEVTPSFGATEELGIFNFAMGIEIPFFIIGDFYEEIDYSTFNVEGQTQSRAIQRITMDGGLIYGLNGFLNIKMKVVKHVHLFTEMNLGYLNADLGGEFTSETESIIGNASIGNFGFEKVFKKSFFSNPGFQLGFLFSF
jgi:hypothetical protein